MSEMTFVLQGARDRFTGVCNYRTYVDYYHCTYPGLPDKGFEAMMFKYASSWAMYANAAHPLRSSAKVSYGPDASGGGGGGY